MSYFKKLARNTFSNVFFKIFTMILGFFSLPLIIHNVGIEEYGLLELSRSILGYFFIFNIGFPTGVTKYVAEFLSNGEQKSINDVINASIIFYLIIASIILGGVLLFLGLDGISLFNISEQNIETAKTMILFAGLWGTIAWPMNNILEGVFAGYQEFPRFNYANSSGITFSYIVTIILAYTGQHIILIQLGQFAADALRWGVQYFMMKKFVDGYKFSLRASTYTMFKRVLSFSSYIFIQKLFTNLTQRSDKIIIGIFLPVTYITVYSVVLKGYHVIRTIFSLFNTALSPMVSELHTKKESRILDDIIFNGSRYMNIMLSVMIITAFFILPAFIGLYVGEKFTPYSHTAQIMVLSLFLTHTRVLLGPYCIGIGKVKTFTWITATTNTVHFLSSILFVYLFGFEGIIFGYVFKGLIRVLLEYIVLFPSLELNPLRFLRKVDLLAEAPLLLFASLIYLLKDYFYSINSWAILFINTFLIGAVLIVFSYLFLIRKDELIKLKSRFAKEKKY